MLDVVLWVKQRQASASKPARAAAATRPKAASRRAPELQWNGQRLCTSPVFGTLRELLLRRELAEAWSDSGPLAVDLIPRPPRYDYGSTALRATVAPRPLDRSREWW
jgi:hypothetical protein